MLPVSIQSHFTTKPSTTMTALTTYKLQGQTAASAPIDTVTVEKWPDGSFHYIPTVGPRVIITDPAMLRLFAEVFTTLTTGYPAKTGVVVRTDS